MTNSLDVREFHARLQRLEALLGEVDRSAAPTAQAHTRELVQLVLELHAAGLERLLDRVAASEDAETILDACASDDVIAGMLLLHGLHPLALEERVRLALDEVRPRLRGHGGDVQLLGVSDGVVRLLLEGNCHGCPSSAVTMRQTVEEAIIAKAPDVLAVEVEGVTEMSSAPANERKVVSLPML
jgi:Fe-S cluster biogenesis protein NfuA